MPRRSGRSRAGGAPPEASKEDAQPKGAKDPRLGRTHDRILEAYGEIAAGTPADRAVKAVFKRARDLGSHERAEVTDVIYGLVRNARAVDDALDRALKAQGKKKDLLDAPILHRMRVLAYLALNGADVETLAARDGYAFKRVPGAIERIASGRLPPVKRGEVEELGMTLSLQDWMITRLLDRFGRERTIEIGSALSKRAPFTLRINAARTTREEAIAAIEREHGITAEPTRLSPLGIILPHGVDVQSWELWKNGFVEVQDEGSQLIALATGAQPKETVLDGCAGAGGKTLALASLMRGTGRLVALDPEEKKLDELKKRLRRAEVTSAETIAADLEAMPKRLLEAHDRVLVDAPCTGSGVYRRNPDARWRVTEHDLERHAQRQQRLITAAVAALRPGGLLTYATCSILWEENEAVVQRALAHDSRIEPVPLATVWGEDISKALGADSSARIGPGPTERDPDGFFVALFRRK
jgi:16S rRNA (cytosine967-C5)-methyltransferase